MLQSKQGLGAGPAHAQRDHDAAVRGKKRNRKRNRGGERTRRRRAMAAREDAAQRDHVRQSKLEAATGSDGLFAFINHSLGSSSEAAQRLRDAGVGRDDAAPAAPATAGAAALASAAAATGGGRGSGSRPAPGRRDLVGSHQEVAAAEVGGCAPS